MTATQIAQLLGPALRAQDFHAVVDSCPLANGYGHKVHLISPGGATLGAVVVYAGKKGPRLVTSELTQPSVDDLTRIANAWRGLGVTPFDKAGACIGPAPQAGTEPATSGTAIELWVDGACLQQSDGLQFGWAFVIQQGSQEVYRHASDRILPYMIPHRNVAAELQAVMHGLEYCRLHQYPTVAVYFDYAGIAEWGTGRWKANTQTTKEYAAFIRAYPLPLTWHKVAAHTGVPMNELVNALATEAARRSQARYRLPT